MKEIVLVCGHLTGDNFVTSLDGFAQCAVYISPEIGRVQTKFGYFEVQKNSSTIFEHIESIVADNCEAMVSNSDHVLNSLRVLVKKGEITLVTHYYDEDGEVHVIRCNEKGKMSAWPVGFFDTFKTLTSQLID